MEHDDRREACRIAEVIPEVTEYTGDDAPGFIISENINRRHLMVGQRAMAVASLIPESKGGRGKSVRRPDGISRQRISEARIVIEHAPELVNNVLSGAYSLDATYKIALERKRDAEGDAGKLETLKAEAPDLAKLQPNWSSAPKDCVKLESS